MSNPNMVLARAKAEPKVISNNKSNFKFPDVVSKGKDYLNKRREGAYNILTSVNAPTINKDDSYGTRLQKTAYTFTAIGKQSFGNVLTSAKEHPVKTAVILGGTAIGLGLASRSVSFLGGVGLGTARQIVGTTFAVGYAGYSEYKQPGSVTTAPGMIGFGTELGTYQIAVGTTTATYKAIKFATPKYIPYFKTSQEVPLTSTKQVKTSQTTKEGKLVFNFKYQILNPTYKSVGKGIVSDIASRVDIATTPTRNLVKGFVYDIGSRVDIASTKYVINPVLNTKNVIKGTAFDIGSRTDIAITKNVIQPITQTKDVIKGTAYDIGSRADIMASKYVTEPIRQTKDVAKGIAYDVGSRTSIFGNKYITEPIRQTRDVAKGIGYDVKSRADISFTKNIINPVKQTGSVIKGTFYDVGSRANIIGSKYITEPIKQTKDVIKGTSYDIGSRTSILGSNIISGVSKPIKEVGTVGKGIAFDVGSRADIFTTKNIINPVRQTKDVLKGSYYDIRSRADIITTPIRDVAKGISYDVGSRIGIATTKATLPFKQTKDVVKGTIYDIGSRMDISSTINKNAFKGFVSDARSRADILFTKNIINPITQTKNVIKGTGYDVGSRIDIATTPTRNVIKGTLFDVGSRIESAYLIYSPIQPKFKLNVEYKTTIKKDETLPSYKWQTEEIPLYEGATRFMSAKQQTLDADVYAPSTYYHVTSTMPSEFYRVSIFGKKLQSTKFLREQGLTEGKFTIREPNPSDVGADRAKFGENFLYLSKGEADVYYGESKVSQFGAVSRGGTQPHLVKIVTESPRRFKELFLRRARPTVLRLGSEVAQPYSKELMKEISSGKTGENLRFRIVKDIKQGDNVLKPGARTSALGYGEGEYGLKVDTDIYLKDAPQRFTYLPNSGTFADVVDVGLSPGKVPKGKYNVKGRVGNVADVYLSDVLNVRSFKGLQKNEKFSEVERKPLAIYRLPIREVRNVVSTRTVDRVPLRERNIIRERIPIRIREPIREIRELVREREPLRDRIVARDIREITGEREPTREREPIREREITREREPVRERERIREREPVRIRERLREREIIRPRDRIREEEPQIKINELGFGKLDSGINTAFNVFVKRKGKFQMVGKRLPFGKASQLGSSKVRGTLAATFKLEEAGTTNLQDIKFAPSSKVFRNFRIQGKERISTPYVFIQKTSREGGLSSGRLSSRGELSEIRNFRAVTI
jgi:hypothetical protein